MGCTSDQYTYGVLWAVAALALYLVAMPAAEGLLLRFYLQCVAKDALQQSEAMTRYSPYASGPDFAFADDLTAEYGIPTDTPSRSEMARQKSGGGRRGSFSTGSHFSRTQSVARREAKELRRIRNKLTQFYDAVRLLHAAYRPEHKYWELSDHFVRVSLMAVLPLLSPDNPSVQSVLALALCVGFLMRLVTAKPYERQEDQLLATVSLGFIIALVLW